MLRDPSGSETGSLSEACDIFRQLGNIFVPRDMSGEARLLLQDECSRKSAFLLPDERRLAYDPWKNP